MPEKETILRKCDGCNSVTPCWNKCVGCGHTLCMFCQVKTNLMCPICGGYFIAPPDF